MNHTNNCLYPRVHNSRVNTIDGWHPLEKITDSFMKEAKKGLGPTPRKKIEQQARRRWVDLGKVSIVYVTCYSLDCIFYFDVVVQQRAIVIVFEPSLLSLPPVHSSAPSISGSPLPPFDTCLLPQLSSMETCVQTENTSNSHHEAR